MLTRFSKLNVKYIYQMYSVEQDKFAEPNWKPKRRQHFMCSSDVSKTLETLFDSVFKP